MSVQPSPYSEGSAFMWTDKHISEQLLELHLNPEIDLASRKEENMLKLLTGPWMN